MESIHDFQPISASQKLEFTNIILDSELKDLIYKLIEIAQNPRSMFYLSKLSTFEIYHDELKKFFQKKIFCLLDSFFFVHSRVLSS